MLMRKNLKSISCNMTASQQAWATTDCITNGDDILSPLGTMFLTVASDGVTALGRYLQKRVQRGFKAFQN